MAVPSCGVALFATGRGDPPRHLDALRRAARACEEAGVELLVLDGRVGDPGRRLDPLSILGALAAETSRLRLGALVAVDERAPALLAKATSTLDVCSDGRAVLVLAPASSSAFAEAAEVLGEAVAITRAMFVRAAPTVEGRHLAVHGAWNEPRAFSGPPPVAVALPAGSPAEAREALRVWAARPDLVLAEIEAPAPREHGDTGADAWATTVPVLRFGRAPCEAAVVHEAGYAGTVCSLGRPEEATAELLARLVAATAR